MEDGGREEEEGVTQLKKVEGKEERNLPRPLLLRTERMAKAEYLGRLYLNLGVCYCNKTKWRWVQFCMIAQATGNQLLCQNLRC